MHRRPKSGLYRNTIFFTILRPHKDQSHSALGVRCNNFHFVGQYFGAVRAVMAFENLALEDRDLERVFDHDYSEYMHFDFEVSTFHGHAHLYLLTISLALTAVF